MTKDLKGLYCYSLDGHFFNGAFDTIDQLATYISELVPSPILLTIGRCTERPSWSVNSGRLFETVLDSVYSDPGSVIETFDLPADLKDNLYKAVTEFLNNYQVPFYKVEELSIEDHELFYQKINDLRATSRHGGENLEL